MSLINDALKRARHESALREAEAKGLPLPVPPGRVFGRGGSRRLRPVLAALAIVAAVALGAVFYLAGQKAARRGGADATDTVVAQTTADAPPAAAPAAAGPAAEREPPRPEPGDPESPAAPVPAAAEATDGEAAEAGAAPGGSPRSAPSRQGTSPGWTAGSRQASRPDAGSPAPAVDPGPSSPSRSAPPSRSVPASPDDPAATGVESISDPSSGLILVLPEAGSSRPAAATATRRPESRGERGDGTASYIQRFETPDGGTIELGGIAWSETGPFALINGQVMGTGSSIHGFVIERIHPRQVELRGGGGTVFLTLQ